MGTRAAAETVLSYNRYRNLSISFHHINNARYLTPRSGIHPHFEPFNFAHSKPIKLTLLDHE